MKKEYEKRTGHISVHWKLVISKGNGAQPIEFNYFIFLIGKAGLYENPLLYHFENKSLLYSVEGRILIRSFKAILKSNAM